MAPLPGTEKVFVRISHGLGAFQIILISMLTPDMAAPLHLKEK